jgi:hypothetical protein
LKWLTPLGIPARLVEDVTTSASDFQRLVLGANITVVCMVVKGRSRVDVLDLAYALYQYCFGTELSWPWKASRRKAMRECMATWEKRVLEECLTPRPSPDTRNSSRP